MLKRDISRYDKGASSNDGRPGRGGLVWEGDVKNRGSLDKSCRKTEVKGAMSRLSIVHFVNIANSGELRNGALQIWRGVVCFSRDFAFRINILNSISTPHKHSFFIVTNVLSLSRDLPHSFLTFYFNPNLHHFINNTCNLIHFFSMTIDTNFMELLGVFLNYLRFVNYNVSC